MNHYDPHTCEGMPHYCVDCGTEIGTGVRCDECVEANRCEYCDAGGFHTNGDLTNHYCQDHCSECHDNVGQDDMNHVVPREDDRFAIDGFEIIDGREMSGGYLCDGCLAELTADEDDDDEPEPVNARDLFEHVDEGDKLLFGDRSEPVTVYRHVTEDDRDGQVFTMAEVTDDWEETLNYDRKHGNHPKAAKATAGDLVDGELTGSEFLVARGPRGGAYVFTQKWTKFGGRWTAQINLFRRTRKPRRVWGWESYVTPRIVGHEDVDRDEFDAGNGPWVRHTDVAGRAMWANTLIGEPSEYDETGAGDDVTVPSEVLERVSEGDVVRINDLPDATVTQVDVNEGGVLADGVMLTLDVDGDEMRVRTISESFKASVFGPDYPHEEVESVDVVSN